MQSKIEKLIKSNIDLSIKIIKTYKNHSDDIINMILNKHNNITSYSLLLDMEKYQNKLQLHDVNIFSDTIADEYNYEDGYFDNLII